MADQLEWLEKAGIENMKLHHVCADNLAKDSGTTLTVLLAGMGGSLAYAAKGLESNTITWFSIGASALTIWFACLGFYLVIKCLMATALPQIYNEPANLNVPNVSFDKLRQAELLNLQARINLAVQRNGAIAYHLNWVRRLAVASPFVFAVSAIIFRRWWGL